MADNIMRVSIDVVEDCKLTLTRAISFLRLFINKYGDAENYEHVSRFDADEIEVNLGTLIDMLYTERDKLDKAIDKAIIDFRKNGDTKFTIKDLCKEFGINIEDKGV